MKLNRPPIPPQNTPQLRRHLAAIEATREASRGCVAVDVNGRPLSKEERFRKK